MDARQLDVLHDAGDEAVFPVADGVGFRLHRMVQKAVDENGTVGGDADGAGHIDPHFLVVVDDLHAPSA